MQKHYSSSAKNLDFKLAHSRTESSHPNLKITSQSKENMWLSLLELVLVLVSPCCVTGVSGYLSHAGPVARPELYGFIKELAPLMPQLLDKDVHVYHERHNRNYHTSGNSYIGCANMFRSLVGHRSASVARLGNPHQLYKTLLKSRNDILVLPGGHAMNYMRLFQQETVASTSIGEELRCAVHDGMVVLAIWAPAYVVSETFDIGGKTRKGLGLFRGHARLAISDSSQVDDIIPMTIELCQGSEQGLVTSVYGGGPSFSSRQPHAVLAKYKGGELDGLSAVVSARCGKGKVILCGIHPESPYLRCHDWAKVFSGLYKDKVDEFRPGDKSLLDVLKRHEPDEECYVTFSEEALLSPEEQLILNAISFSSYDNDQHLRCEICGVENLMLNLQLIELILTECMRG